MKKRIVIPVIIVIALVLGLVLFLPVPKGSYLDGGTREYAALTYKIVVWNKFVSATDENGHWMPVIYHNTSVYWYPNNRKSIDELWQMEISENETNFR